MTNPRNQLGAALHYARKGWRVFPCATDKRPLVKDWPHVATTDEVQIRRWWAHDPRASIGCPTGPDMGAFVLDVDLPEGPATLAALESEHGALPPTMEQMTGGGGRQLFFRWIEGREVKNSAGKLGVGLDVRGAGGYVILPPSGHPSGGRYAWKNSKGTPLAEAPAWLLDLVAPLPRPFGLGYGRAALDHESAKVAVAAPGTRNATLNEAAFAIGQLVAGGEVDRFEAEGVLLAAAQTCGLPEGEARKTIASGMAAGEKEPRTAPEKPYKAVDTPQIIAPGKTEGVSWALARELFPRTPFPWTCLPGPVAASLKQLARACATSDLSLPGQAICLLAAAVGRKLNVQAKASWHEPLVFWCCDIRETGAGKTSPMWALAKEMSGRQEAEHERFKAEVEEWERTSPQDRHGMTPPHKPRGYFTTNLTLEGIHSDLDGHKTGGLAVVLSEMSALISGQNQYKKGGTDREGWLCLHDGKPARVTRAKGSIFIKGARVQVCGGIQPDIFRQTFGGGGGQYLADGTVFRTLFTFEPSQFYELTTESWTDECRSAWDNLFAAALNWADAQEEPHSIALAPDAQARFFEWRNALDIKRQCLPPAFRGFLPKGYGYALRLAGALHAMKRFARGATPGNILTLAEMERGVLAVHFYLGQAVDALRLLVADGVTEAPAEVSDRTVLLAQVLARLHVELDNGRLAVGRIADEYNAACRHEGTMSAHAMGALIRSCGLTISNGLHDANGRKRVRCLVWDARTDSFAKQSLGSLGSLETECPCGFLVRDFAPHEVSEVSHAPTETCETCETSENQSLAPGSPVNTGLRDNRDNRDLSRATWSGPREVEL